MIIGWIFSIWLAWGQEAEFCEQGSDASVPKNMDKFWQTLDQFSYWFRKKNFHEIRFV
jgi:hypothetical protein